MKTNYYRDKLELNKNNMKQTWSTLKEAIGKQNNKLNFPKSFNIDNKNVSNRSEIAEQFNKYFSKIGASTANNVPKTSKKYTDYIQNPSLNSMLLEQIDQHHIIDAANKLKPKTSSGHDDISTKIMNETIQNIILPITHIINRSFASGILPDQMKRAKVIPIYKSSSQNELSPHQPTTCLFKINRENNVQKSYVVPGQQKYPL